MKLKEKDVKKSVQSNSTKGDRPEVLVGQAVDSNVKVSGIDSIDAASTKKLDVKSSEDIQVEDTQSVALRTGEYPIIGYFDGDPENLPTIVPELASIRPPDSEAFNVLEQMIIRDGVVDPLVVGVINGKKVLLDGHMRLECIIKHNIKSFKVVQLDIPSLEVDDSRPHDEYIDWLGNVMYESSKLGRDGMRLVNVFPLTTEKNYRKGTDYKHSLLADLIYKIKELNSKHDDCNLLFWGHFNWFKNHSGGRVCQGSMSCSSPVLRPDSEYIGVWVKATKKLENIHGTDCKPRKSNVFSDTDRDKYVITPEEYIKYTNQTWQISPIHDNKHRHPARFPFEIPHRLIKLFTYPQDTILDPFCGSGTSCLAAKNLKRNYIGIDKVAGYCNISRDRLAELDREEDASKEQKNESESEVA